MEQASTSSAATLPDVPVACAKSAAVSSGEPPVDAGVTIPVGPPVPHTFWQYLRSFGPGIVIVLTWHGAGDIVDMGVAGSNFGYALMWILVLSLVMRFLFVSLIARYQLCNQFGEGVLDGLVRLHPLYAPVLLIAVVVMSHAYLSYMTIGMAEVWINLTGVGQMWQWAVLLNITAFSLVFQPAYRVLEIVFLILLGFLSVSFLGCALWVGFDPGAIVKGLYRLEMPGEEPGKFNPLLVGVAMIGAVGGSLMNLAYPYFLEAKGWRGPKYRKVQSYDLLLGIIVLIILNLAVWVLGAELLHPLGIPINKLDDLPRLLSNVLGEKGRWLFYLGIFATVYMSVIGHVMGLACIGTHSWMRWNKTMSRPVMADFRRHRLFTVLVIWSLFSPLIWTMPGTSGDFVTLTLAVNSAQVLLLPLLAGGLWWITADARYIGREHRNRWWENVLMAVLVGLALWGAVGSIRSVAQLFLHR